MYVLWFDCLCNGMKKVVRLNNAEKINPMYKIVTFEISVSHIHEKIKPTLLILSHAVYQMGERVWCGLALVRIGDTDVDLCHINKTKTRFCSTWLRHNTKHSKTVALYSELNPLFIVVQKQDAKHDISLFPQFLPFCERWCEGHCNQR